MDNNDIRFHPHIDIRFLPHIPYIVHVFAKIHTFVQQNKSYLALT